MPMIAAFMREHPGITIRWKLGNSAGLLEALAACEIEVAVVTLIDPPEGMASAKIAGQRLMGCVPIAKAPVSLSLQALATGPLIVREPGSMTRLMLERAFADHGLTPKICLDVASREAAKEAIAAGIGFGIVLDGEIGKDTRLAAVQIKAPPICGNFYAVALPESPDVPSVRAFFSGLDESP
jgi:DNA-binding transcriptional LysR family regulator